MRRQRTTLPAPWPIQRIRITDRAIRVRSKGKDLVLTFQDTLHVEAFLAAFGDAWMRWDEVDDGPSADLDDLQQALPF